MLPPQGLNWIGGRWRPSDSGHEFELDSLLAPFWPRGRWPRSGPPELREALSEGARAEPVWERTPRAERARILVEAWSALERDTEVLCERLAPGLGLSSEIVRQRLEVDSLRAREGLEILRDGAAPRSGTGLFAAHWSDLVGPLLQRLAPWLLGGSPAVLLADPRLPEAADALCRSLEAAGLPPGVVSLVHDDTETVLRAALGQTRLAWVRARGGRAELACQARGRAGEGFGAGLTEWSLWPLSSAVHLVPWGADPAQEAQRVLERALGPSDTLCGQLPDAVGRVLCHQRQLSRFTAELLARLDAQAVLARPLVPVEADLCAWLSEAWALGLDEGACPIFGEAPGEAPRDLGPSPAGAAEATERPQVEVQRGRAPRAVRALVFTNVETGGRLLRLERSAPLLRLARVGSDQEAQRWRDELVRGAVPARLE